MNDPTTAGERGASGRAYRRTKAQKEEFREACHWQACGRIECAPKTVCQLMEKMRLRIVPGLRSQNMISERIAEQLGVDLAPVEAVCRREVLGRSTKS